LFSRRPIERLQPKVVDSAVADRVDNRFGVAREADDTASRVLEIQNLRGLIGIHREQRQLFHMLGEMTEGSKNDSLRVGRDIKCGREFV